MGSADLVPGVSGGTMALILGIYTRLLEAIKSFDMRWVQSLLRLDLHSVATRPHFGFLLPLLVGIAGALAFFTRVVPLPVLLKTHPEQIYGLFFGLIIGSIIILMREVQHYRPLDVVMVAAGAGAGLFVVNLVPMETPDASWFVFLSGAVAICAMVLPGISGSFILLILRKYEYVVGAVGTLDFGVLVPFALGAVTGLVLFTRLLVWMLHHYYRQTLLVIKGILIGSLWVIWPFQDRVFATFGDKEKLISSHPVWPAPIDGAVLGSAALMVAGLFAVLVIHALAGRNVPASKA